VLRVDVGEPIDVEQDDGERVTEALGPLDFLFERRMKHRARVQCREGSTMAVSPGSSVRWVEKADRTSNDDRRTIWAIDGQGSDIAPNDSSKRQLVEGGPLHHVDRPKQLPDADGLVRRDMAKVVDAWRPRLSWPVSAASAMSCRIRSASLRLNSASTLRPPANGKTATGP